MVVVMNREGIIRHRIRSDISQVELAAELGISKRALQYFEAGDRPMPRLRDRDDYVNAIEAIKARRAAQKQAS